jgi:uncharacterized protein
MKITFDPVKRKATLTHRGLDFADAARVFEGDHATWMSDQSGLGEDRYITQGGLTAGWWFSFGPNAATTAASFR